MIGGNFEGIITSWSTHGTVLFPVGSYRCLCALRAVYVDRSTLTDFSYGQLRAIDCCGRCSAEFGFLEHQECRGTNAGGIEVLERGR